MHTDLQLKWLTQHRPADVLTLLQANQVTVIGVETRELPASSARLDSLLKLQASSGQPYLHLIEWQGYQDKLLLWRVMGYLAWLGQHHKERPIRATIIYLTPGDDVGAELVQRDGPAAVGDWQLQLSVVRLWEQDAATVLASGVPGLLVLLPFMQGASASMVEQAAQQLLTTTPPPQQDDLLLILGIFAEALIPYEWFTRLVTKERLMKSELVDYLVREGIQERMPKAVEEVLQEALPKAVQEAVEEALPKAVEEALPKAVKEALPKAVKEALPKAVQEVMQKTVYALRASVAGAVVVRFPSLPTGLVQRIERVTDSTQLQALISDLLLASDQAAVERLLAALPEGPAA